ncbi:MAG: hypothetical protein HY304_04655 [candidate division Zixibacteria bacterium]|nr:hypothetical protein [candidate division Zixibacteria bacterium]
MLAAWFRQRRAENLHFERILWPECHRSVTENGILHSLSQPIQHLIAPSVVKRPLP